MKIIEQVKQTLDDFLIKNPNVEMIVMDIKTFNDLMENYTSEFSIILDKKETYYKGIKLGYKNMKYGSFLFTNKNRRYKMMDFKLYHLHGNLIAEVVIDGLVYRQDVTDYFENENPHDDWLDYRIGLEKIDSVFALHFKK